MGGACVLIVSNGTVPRCDHPWPRCGSIYNFDELSISEIQTNFVIRDKLFSRKCCFATGVKQSMGATCGLAWPCLAECVKDYRCGALRRLYATRAVPLRTFVFSCSAPCPDVSRPTPPPHPRDFRQLFVPRVLLLLLAWKGWVEAALGSNYCQEPQSACLPRFRPFSGTQF